MRINQTERFCITSYLQLRELDLSGRDRFGCHRPPLQHAGSSSSHSSFCEEVFSVCVVAGTVDPGRCESEPNWRFRSRLQPNEVDRTNILAPGVCSDLGRNHLLPAFTPETFRGLAQLGSRIQLQQRNCSRFARDFLRRSTFPSSQRTGSRISGLRSPLQDFFRTYPAGIATNRRPSPLIAPSAASVTSCSAKA